MLRRILLVLLTALLALTGWAGTALSAYAGGPTSVLMINPELGRASALHIANADYDRLYAAVGGDVTRDPEPPIRGYGGEEVRLTWLIHDVQIWRIDRVYLSPDLGIWVETVTELKGEGHPFEQPSRWHRPADDQALTALLTKAGLLGAGSAPSSPTASDGSPPVTAASSAAAQPVVPIVVAAVGGLAVGAVGSLLLRRRPTVDRRGVSPSG